MKKFLAFLLLFILNSHTVYAEFPLYAKYLTKGIEIVSPDGEKTSYTNVDEVPEIQYASKIFALGMVILSFYGVDFTLKNRQGLFVAKSPVTEEFVFSKVENSNNGAIPIIFDKNTKAELTPEAKISFKRENDSLTLKVLMGTVPMEVNGNKSELAAGEIFTYKIKEGDENAF
jgi:hypothetical protein